MVLVDGNLLIYAGVAGQAEHLAAAEWLHKEFTAGHRMGLPGPSLLAFLRISTNPRLYERPARIEEALGVVEGWLRFPTVWVPGATARHGEILGGLLTHVRAQGNTVPDAPLEALAIEHGLELSSTDSNFARFEGLRWRNPLRG